MNNFIFLTDEPNNSDENKYYLQGSSPRLLQEFFSFLDKQIENIDSIFVCMFLYNNPPLHIKLKSLASKGIDVNVVSIPLEGYDDRFPKRLNDIESGKIVHDKTTKKIYL